MDITAEIIAAFRANKRQFTDPERWPDDIVSEAICDGLSECGSTAWGQIDYDDCGNFRRRGVFLFAAHSLHVEYNTASAATSPESVNPTARLNVASRSVRDESVTYRVGSIQKTEDDWLSLTNYGVQFLRLRGRAKCAVGAIAL